MRLVFLSTIAAFALVLPARADVSFGQPVAGQASGPIGAVTACPLGVTAAIPGSGTALIDVRSIGTQTLRVQASADQSNWTADLPVYPVGGGASITSITANGQWTIPVVGQVFLCVYGQAWTSGTATVRTTFLPTAKYVIVEGYGTAGTPSGGVVTMQGVASGVGFDAAGRFVVVGPVADGASTAGINPIFEGFGFNGVALTPRYCDKSITFSTLGTTARVQQIAAVATQHIYLCGWQLFGSTATTGIDLTWTEGTGSNCATGTATIGGKFLTTPTAAPTTPNSTWGPSNPALRWTITAGDALCITQSSATNSTTLAGTIFYTQN